MSGKTSFQWKQCPEIKGEQCPEGGQCPGGVNVHLL